MSRHLSAAEKARHSRFLTTEKPSRRQLRPRELRACGHEGGYRCACHPVEDHHEPDVVEHLRQPYGVRLSEAFDEDRD